MPLNKSIYTYIDSGKKIHRTTFIFMYTRGIFNATF